MGTGPYLARHGSGPSGQEKIRPCLARPEKKKKPLGMARSPFWALPPPPWISSLSLSLSLSRHFKSSAVTPPSATMSQKYRGLILRTLLFLFALNSVYLALYFLFHLRPSSSSNETLTLDPPSFPSLKRWPSLPSFLPWSLSPPPPPHSCEAYFGHGFSRRIDVLRPSSSSSGGEGWFRCYYSETLSSSICEGGRIQMDPGRISMSEGGEALEAVMGHGEDELPKYEPGAFEIEAGEEGVGHTDRRSWMRNFLIDLIQTLVGRARLARVL